MKLIYCPSCSDVVKLRLVRRRNCECGMSYGYYAEDGLNAVIGGLAVPLGFANPTFKYALDHRPKDGAGYQFEAFVIPVECPTIKQETAGGYSGNNRKRERRDSHHRR